MTSKKIGIYVRVSTDLQQSGLESQRRTLIEYCNAKQLTDFTIYEDFGISGAKSSRPGLDRLMADAKSGHVATVLVYSFSRFARSTRHLLDALSTFEDLGIGFISVTESIDTKSAIGKALFTIISAISQLERELIGERVRNGLRNAKAKGRQIGRLKTRNSMLIRELRSKGYSYRKIAALTGVSLGTVGTELATVQKGSEA